MKLTLSIYILFLALALTCAGQSQKVGYTYDDAGRLINADYGNGTSIAYTYDKAGNLLSRVVTAASQAKGAKARQSAPRVEKNADTNAGQPFRRRAGTASPGRGE